MRSVFKFRLELRIHKSGLDRRVAYQKLWWKRKEKDAFIRGPLRGLYEVYTRSVYMVCPGARHELLKRDCSTWAGTCCENNEQLKHEKKSQLLILSPNGIPARQTFWELNRRTFHHLLYLHLFSIHSHCFCSFTSGIVFLHFAFMFLLLVFMSIHFNCMSFYFDDPRSGMYNPMSVKRILNAKGTTFTWMFFYKGTAVFYTTGTVFNICLYNTPKYACLRGTGIEKRPRPCLFLWKTNQVPKSDGCRTAFRWSTLQSPCPNG